MFWDLAHFIACLALAMLIIRAVQMRMNKDSDTGKAIAWLFH